MGYDPNDSNKLRFEFAYFDAAIASFNSVALSGSATGANYITLCPHASSPADINYMDLTTNEVFASAFFHLKNSIFSVNSPAFIGVTLRGVVASNVSTMTLAGVSTDTRAWAKSTHP